MDEFTNSQRIEDVRKVWFILTQAIYKSANVGGMSFLYYTQTFAIRIETFPFLDSKVQRRYQSNVQFSILRNAHLDCWQGTKRGCYTVGLLDGQHVRIFHLAITAL